MKNKILDTKKKNKNDVLVFLKQKKLIRLLYIDYSYTIILS